VRNVGQGNAVASKIDFFVDPAGLPAVGQTGNLRADVPALAAGATHTANAVVSGVTSPALVFALADSTNLVPESDENNNLGPWANLNASVAKPVSTDVPLAIPSPGSVESALQVSSTITSLRYIAVDLGIAHTFDEDLVITLIAPSGAEVVLSNKKGGSGHNFTGTIFHDGAATAIANGTAPFTGEFRPDQPLAALLGTNPNGTWRLKVTDDTDDLFFGTLQSWGLRLW
jgi:subtilisin-like proprotein convertase family protein